MRDAPDPQVAQAAAPVRRRIRRPPPVRPWLRCAVGVLVVLVLAVVWLGVRGGLAARDLVHGRSALLAARTELSAGDPAQAASDLARARDQLSAASDYTGDPVWHLASHLPILGNDLRATHGIASAGALAASASLPLVRDLDADLTGHTLRSASGTVDLHAVAALASPLGAADALLTQAGAVVAGSGNGGLGPVARARAQVADSVSSLQATVEAARRVVAVAPQMLGGTAPQHYLIAFQNPAEARGTGGYLGAYAEVTADAGRLHVDRVGTDDQLTQASAPVVNVSPDFTARWRPFSADSYWGNANLTPDFPSAALVWRSLWQHATGQRLDGVIAVDPQAVGYLTSVTGPLTLPDGTILTGSTLAAYVESGEYLRYPTDLTARRTQLRAVISDAARALTSGQGGAATLLQALSRGASQGRLLLDSADPGIEQQLVTGGVAGELPDQPGPFAAAVTDNAGGNKMDHYLDTSLAYRSTGCATATRPATITVTLRNTGPTSGLPLYVAGYDAMAPGSRFAVGTDRVLLSVYAAVGSTVGTVTVDGRPVAAPSSQERRHPVVTTYVNVAPGGSDTVVVHLTEPASGALVPYRQPAQANPQPRDIAVDDCPADAPLALPGDSATG